MIFILNNVRLIFVAGAFLAILAFYFHDHSTKSAPDARQLTQDVVLDEAQGKTDAADQELRALAASSGMPMLQRGDVGILTFLANQVIKPFIEVRLDYYVSKLGITDSINKYNDITAGLRIVDRTQGTGHAVLCGQTVDAVVHETMLVNDPVARNVAGTRRFTLGQGTVPLGLELGVLGMKVGGTRLLAVSPALTVNRFSRDGGPIPLTAEYKVTLNDVTPTYPESAHSLYYVDKVSRLERRVICGSLVLANIRVIDSDNGQVVYERTEPFKFRVGSHEVPLAVELGVMDMRVFGTRLLIAPADLLQVTDRMDKDFLAMPLNKDRATLLEITMVDSKTGY